MLVHHTVYTTFQWCLQGLATLFMGGSTFYRNWDNHHMLAAAILSFLGGATFCIYSILTGQWILIPLNAYTSIMAIRGMWVWKNTKTENKK